MPISRRTRLVGTALTVAGAALALSACAHGPAPVAPAFTACGRSAADPSTTDFRPRQLSAADRSADVEHYGEIPEGDLVVESAGSLELVDGMLGAGSGYEAATATVKGVKVAPATVTANVSLLVLDSEKAGRRVAYLELRLADERAATWREEPGLGIGTDGGDGGFVATSLAPPLEPDSKATDSAPFDMLEAFYPHSDSTSGNICVLRTTDGTLDGVLFSTGWGDGGYPTYLGLGQDDRVVAVVSEGWIVPWGFSGLPGTPPEQA